MKNKLVFIIVILALLAGISGYWHWQRNVFSKDALKLEILGPRETEIAQEVEYVVRYRNTGHIRLEEPRLIFEFPEQAILEQGKSPRQEIGADKLGIAIYPGEERILRFRARLLGKEGQSLTARAALSYRPKNLEARYESATTFTTVIKSVPLVFAFDLPSKIEPGKDFEFRINYFSNIDYPLLGLRITADYPAGFEFIESIPRALEKNEWELPPLNRAEGGRVKITGRISGRAGEQRIFRANLGLWREGEFILLKTIAKGIELSEPGLNVAQRINGRLNYVASPGEHLHYEILFKNTGEETLTGLSLSTTLLGDIFDLESLRAPQGDFTLGGNSITWDWRRVGHLQFLNPGEEGKVEFWIRLKKDWEIIDLEGKTVIQNRVFLGQVKEEFTVKVNSRLEVSQKVFFQDEVFGNLGPIPPQAGLPTTYTVMWLARNHYNEMRNVKIKAILPQNVRVTGKIFPEQEIEKFTFDSASREIVWQIGAMEVGQGIFNPAPHVAFQIAFTPDDFQKGRIADLIGRVEIIGEDTWTGQVLRESDQAIDTTLPDDPTITDEMGIIQ